MLILMNGVHVVADLGVGVAHTAAAQMEAQLADPLRDVMIPTHEVKASPTESGSAQPSQPEPVWHSAAA